MMSLIDSLLGLCRLLARLHFSSFLSQSYALSERIKHILPDLRTDINSPFCWILGHPLDAVENTDLRHRVLRTQKVALDEFHGLDMGGDGAFQLRVLHGGEDLGKARAGVVSGGDQVVAVDQRRGPGGT